MDHPTPDIPIIVLAAGGSTRMRGRDKLMELVDGQPLIRGQAQLARSATDGAVLVALPPPPHPRYGALDGLDVTRVAIADAHEGMNASLRASFAALPPDTPAAMVLLADLPDLTLDDLRNVMREVDLDGENMIWRGATQSGEPGHPIVFSARLFPLIARLSGDGGGRSVVAQAKGRIRLVPLPSTGARMDLDTPEDWAAWRAARRPTD